MPERFVFHEGTFFIDQGKRWIELEPTKQNLPLIAAHTKAEIFKTDPYSQAKEEITNFCEAFENKEK